MNWYFIVPPRAISGAFEATRLRQHARLWAEIRDLPPFNDIPWTRRSTIP